MGRIFLNMQWMTQRSGLNWCFYKKKKKKRTQSREDKTMLSIIKRKMNWNLFSFFLPVSFQLIFWWWKYNLMCTKKKLEWIQVTETFTSLRVCACGCICVNIYMYTCGRHTPTQWTFLKSICMLTSRADVCVETEPLPPSPLFILYL